MRLLLAEDDKELSNAIIKVLKLNKYDVEAVYDGEDALYCLKTFEYDGAIMDVMMPKMDGITAIKKAREAKIQTPILVLTAKAEIDDKVTGLDAGADDYLTKPFSIKELLARIRALTRRTAQSFEILEVGNISLNSDTFELKTEVGSIRLTNKEYKLMELFIRNQNKCLSSERIMDNVWQYESDAEINVVWVYISALRKKLDSIKANYNIKAARGVGYKLEKVDD